jgi:hypothetical protein
MILSLLLGIAALHGCTKGSEFEPSLCPSQLPAIADVTIRQFGVRDYPEQRGEPPCTDFRPTKAQVIRYLSKARTTSFQSADATLDRLPCRASGTVRFVDGTSGQWWIERLGVATLAQPGHEDVLLYCRECTEPPFAH